LVVRIKFHFRYSFNKDSNSQPFNPVIKPYINGCIVFSKERKNVRKVTAYELYVKDCPILPGNFHKIRYSPKDQLVMNGNPLINKYIEEQRKIEKEFDKYFK